MNESPWQPPADGQPPADPPARPNADTTDPSPWSPEGAASWTRPPDPSLPPAPVVPSPPSTGPTAGPAPDEWARPAATTPAPPAADAWAEPGPTATTPTAKRRSKVVVGAAVLAVGALGLAGLFAVQRMSGDANAGGGATADELGADLLAAIEAEDVLGVIDTMLPGERESLGDPFVATVGELQRLEVLSPDTDLSRLLGLDVEFQNELVETRGTNVPDIVNVRLTADAAVTLDGATLPIGDFVESQLPPDVLTELRGTRLTETDQLDLELTAVQHDDRWYFSAFHTIAELARRDAGGEPIPSEGVTPDGADSPEAAVDRLLDRVEQLDLRGVIATLDPAEAAALQRYAPLFLDDAEAALAEVPLDWRVDVREFRVEGDGDARTVFVDAIGITGSIEGGEFTVRFSDGCVTAEMDGESIEQCGATDPTADLDALFGDAPAIEAFTTTVAEAFADMQPVGLELRQRDGAWYVSPLATVTEAMLAAMRALDRGELDAIVDTGEEAIDEFFDVFFGFGDPFVIEEEWAGGDVITDDGFTDDGFGDDGFGQSDPGQECYAEPKAADAAACFRRYVDAGELDPMIVPAALLYPECGMAELQWEGGLFDLSDAEFSALLDEATPCFDDLVASGELEEWMVPYEVANAECFEGRNWYAEFDDVEYLERVDACIFGGE